MTEVYLLELFKPSNDVYVKMLDFVSEEKREKIANIKSSENQLQTLMAEVLLRVILCTRFGMENKNIAFNRDSNGKPYLNKEQVHFNISHSKNQVAVAISQRNVGVDLEKIRDVNVKLIERYFTEKEKEYISINKINWQTRFFEVWTKKEAFLKMSGLGIRVKLDELETGEFAAVKTFNLDGFVLSVCSDDQDIYIFNNEESHSIICEFFEQLYYL